VVNPWQLKQLRAGDVLDPVAAVARRQPHVLGPHDHQAVDLAKQRCVIEHDHSTQS
jgi:hypothetical protein